MSLLVIAASSKRINQTISCNIHSIRRQHYSSKQIKSKPLTNIIATKILKELYTNNEHKTDKTKLISNAINIYESINEPRDYIAVNAFIKICLNVKNPSKISLIWKDIEIL
eukprot:457036_1